MERRAATLDKRTARREKLLRKTEKKKILIANNLVSVLERMTSKKKKKTKSRHRKAKKNKNGKRNKVNICSKSSTLPDIDPLQPIPSTSFESASKSPPGKRRKLSTSSSSSYTSSSSTTFSTSSSSSTSLSS